MKSTLNFLGLLRNKCLSDNFLSKLRKAYALFFIVYFFKVYVKFRGKKQDHEVPWTFICPSGGGKSGKLGNFWQIWQIWANFYLPTSDVNIKFWGWF